MKTIQFRTHHFHDVWQCINKRLLLVGSLLIASPYLLQAEAPKSPRGGGIFAGSIGKTRQNCKRKNPR